MENRKTTDVSTSTIVTRPAVESLLWGDSAGAWKGIEQNQFIRNAASHRHSAATLLENLMSAIEDSNSLLEACDKGLIQQSDLIELYKQLSLVLREGFYSYRLTLYLPFELFSAKMFNFDQTAVAESYEFFVKIFKESFSQLFTDEDARPDFINGDIPKKEVQREPIEMVIKATHLFPFLRERDVFSTAEFYKLCCEKRLAIKGFRESLNYADTRMSFSAKEQRFLYINLGIRTQMNEESSSTHVVRLIPATSTLKLESDLRIRLREIDSSYKKNLKNMILSRAHWEKIVARQNFVKEFSEGLYYLTRTRKTTYAEILKLLFESKVADIKLVAINTFYLVLRDQGRKEPSHVERILDFDRVELRNFYFSGTEKVRTAMQEAFLKLNSLNYVTDNTLREFEIWKPKLSDTVDPTRKHLQTTIDWISSKCKNLKESPLMEKVFPVVLFYGSKTKGYATPTADVDLAVFIRPGKKQEELRQIREDLFKHFQSEEIKGTLVQFWLKEDAGDWIVHDHPKPENDLGRSYFSHVFMQGIWIGERESVEKLHQKFLKPYLFGDEGCYDDTPARKLWLHKMERDSLLCRLLHKGYLRSNVLQVPESLRLSTQIDGDSPFWDSNYRCIASQLFLKKVFLPNLNP